MSITQISTSVSILNVGLKGWQAISLSAFDTASAPTITSGSTVEIGGAFFLAASDETPQATTWTPIVTGNTSYVTLTPTGAAGSQTITTRWSSDSPTWDDAKQGFYDSTSTSVIRYIGGVYKQGATSYEKKFLLSAHESSPKTVLVYNSTYSVIGSGAIREEIIEIGTWDMNDAAIKHITIGELATRFVVNLSAIIYDDGGFASTLQGTDSSGSLGGAPSYDRYNGRISLSRSTSGRFDTISYDDTSINRGYVTIKYLLI